jgi:hypothetical protein
VKVQLDDYPATPIYEQFTVSYDNCMITNLDFTSIADMEYNIYTDEVKFEIPEFTQVVEAGFTKAGATTCAYEITYDVTLADGSALPDFIKWDPIDRVFSYHSIVESDEAEYNIKMTASVSANFQDTGFTKDLTFKVDVQNGCATDNIGFDSYITD